MFRVWCEMRLKIVFLICNSPAKSCSNNEKSAVSDLWRYTISRPLSLVSDTVYVIPQAIAKDSQSWNVDKDVYVCGMSVKSQAVVERKIFSLRHPERLMTRVLEKIWGTLLVHKDYLQLQLNKDKAHHLRKRYFSSVFIRTSVFWSLCDLVYYLLRSSWNCSENAERFLAVFVTSRTAHEL